MSEKQRDIELFIVDIFVAIKKSKEIVQNNIDLSVAIKSEIDEYKKLNDLIIVNFLKIIKKMIGKK